METMEQVAIALFQYIKELCAIRHTIVSDVKKQPLYIFADEWVRDEENINLYDRDRVDGQEESSNPDLLRIHKPEFTRCPALPRSLDGWLEHGWDDYKKRARVKESRKIEEKQEAEESEQDDLPEQNDSTGSKKEELQKVERFADNQERVNAYVQWEKLRAEWVIQQERIHSVRELFKQFYEVRNLLIKDPDTYEFMVGNGVLEDRQQSNVCHPVLLKKVSIKMVANGNTLIVSDAESDSELYTMFINSIEGINTDGILQIESDIKNNEIHPFDRNEGKDVLKSLIHLLSAKGCYLDSSEKKAGKDDRYIMRWNPVFFVRKRIDGSIATIGGIIDDIGNGAKIPGSLSGVLGSGESSGSREYSEETEYTSSVTTSYKPDLDILLPKPANQEQLDIAIQIEKHPAVLVQGPPGTGKTHTIANLLGHFLAQGKRVLVTSQTNKALRVLKEKVPENIQHLCVTVLDDSNKDMELSVNGIVEYMATHTPMQVKREADALKAKRDGLQKQLEAAKERVFMIRNKEFMPIAFQGDSYSPAMAAKFVSEHQEWLELVPGHISAGMPFPLSVEETVELYRTNIELSTAEECELKTDLPNEEDCMSPAELKEYVELEKNAETVLRSIGTQIGKELIWMRDLQIIGDAVTGDPFIRVSDAAHIDALETFLKQYPEQYEYVNWIYRVIADSQRGGSRKENWNKLIRVIDDTYQYSEEVAGALFGKKIEISDKMPLGAMLEEYNEMYELAQKKGSIGKPGIFTPKIRKQAMESVLINGELPLTFEQIGIARNAIVLKQKRAELALLWDALMMPCGENAFTNLGDAPEQLCKGKGMQIARFLNWFDVERLNLIDLIQKAGIDKSFIKKLELNAGIEVDESTAKMMMSFIIHQVEFALKAANLLRRITVYEQKRQIVLTILQEKQNSSICANLMHALSELNYDAYAANLQVLIALKKKSTVATLRQNLLNKVGSTAHEWAVQLESRTGIHGNSEPPTDLIESWNCKQLDQIVHDIACTSLSEAEKEVYRLSTQLRKVTAELSAKMAWYHMLQRIHGDLNIQQALNGWKQTIKKIGKGTGKKAPMYRREAKSLMTRCQKAVPAWIMSVTKVMDTIDPRQTKFDVIIIDEASQCDVTAMALLYLGKKVIVVGDDEQVSPMAVGANEGQIQVLANTYIKDKIPNWHLFGLKDSLYNIVAMSYKPLMLREHFRCVPDIIGYSNMLAYNYGIKPLREAGSAAVYPGVVPYRVSGRRSGKSKTNVAEAETIVALMMACMEQPEYENETFGVVSLLGNDQVKLIDRILYEKIDLVKREERRILCGDASSFQGDERDVIFLSMVDSNEADGPLKLTGEGVGGATKQRYNVAVSRAKDQLWVVHSLDYTRDLKEGDIRRGLLEYVSDPHAYELKVKEIEKDSESIFEEEVAKYLAAAGYHIKQQWKVGAYRIDMVAIYKNQKIAIECDGEKYHSSDEQVRNDIERQSVLERLGWRFIRIRGSEYFRDKAETMKRVISELEEYGIFRETDMPDNVKADSESELLKRVKLRAAQILSSWNSAAIEETESEIQEGAPELSGSVSESVEEPLIQNVPEVVFTADESIQNIPNAISVPEQTKLIFEEQETAIHVEPVQLVMEMPAEIPGEDYLTTLKNNGLEFVDNSQTSNIIWVMYSSERRAAFEHISAEFDMKYKLERRGSIATGGKPAWRVMCK